MQVQIKILESGVMDVKTIQGSSLVANLELSVVAPNGATILSFDGTPSQDAGEQDLATANMPLDANGNILLGDYSVSYVEDVSKTRSATFNPNASLGLKLSTEVKVGCVEVKATDATNYSFTEVSRLFELVGPTVNGEAPQTVSSTTAKVLSLTPKWDNSEYVASLVVVGNIPLNLKNPNGTSNLSVSIDKKETLTSKVDVLILSSKKIACGCGCDGGDYIKYLKAIDCGDYSTVSDIASKYGCDLSGPILLENDCGGSLLRENEVGWEPLPNVTSLTKTYGQYKVYVDRIAVNALYTTDATTTDFVFTIKEDITTDSLPTFKIPIYNQSNVVIGMAYIEGGDLKFDVVSSAQGGELNINGTIQLA